MENLDAALTQAVEAEPGGLVSAYWFGSHAEGRAHRESDIDVGVLLDWTIYRTRQARFDARVRLAASLAAALGVPGVDVVVLNEAPPLLARHIVTHGRRVFSADAEADHAFVRDAQLCAADLEPFLRRFARLKLDATARR